MIIDRTGKTSALLGIKRFVSDKHLGIVLIVHEAFDSSESAENFRLKIEDSIRFSTPEDRAVTLAAIGELIEFVEKERRELR